MPTRDLDELFARFRDRGDGAALAAIFDATARELYGVACHLVRDPAQAEDLVQGTFLTAVFHGSRITMGNGGSTGGRRTRNACRRRSRA